MPASDSSSDAPPNPTAPAPRSHPAGTTGRVLAVIAVAVVVLLGGIGTYEFVASHSGNGTTLVVYTYESLLGGCGSDVLTRLAQSFDQAHHAQLDIECVSGTLSSLLIQQKNAPSADLVVGLDEITGPQADAAGVLLPYQSPELANVSPALVDELAPDHSVTPYESGYLAVDYTPAFAASTGGAVANFSLPMVASNSTWAKNLLFEDPTTDIVGEEFLLSEIAFYETVLGSDWTTFWKAADPNLGVSDSWSDAYGAFNASDPSSPGMVVSFNTDPAASVVGSSPPAYHTSLYHWNGATYGWRTIYGVGIVKGTQHLALDEAFVDWFLEGAVQSQIPTNEWEYPANVTTPLPPVFAWAENPPGVVPLNPGIPYASIPGSLAGWQDEWQTLWNKAHG